MPAAEYAAVPPARRQGQVDELVGKAAAGDPAAVQLLLATIRPVIVRYCRARMGAWTGLHLTADDVAQEVSLAVLVALPTFPERNVPFLRWTFGIAHNKVADVYRAAQRDRCRATSDVLPDVATSTFNEPEALVLRGELTSRLDHMLQWLPARQREIVALRIVVGLSAEETAEAVNSTPTQVRVAQHRALQTLRKRIQAEGI